MGKIKKVFNIKIISLIMGISFLCISSSYPYSSKNSLRVPVNQKSLSNRMIQSMKKEAETQGQTGLSDSTVAFASEETVETAIEATASQLHEQWKADFVAKNGEEAPRWKPAKDSQFETRVRAEFGSKGVTVNEAGNIRINDKGNVEIDIAHTDFRDLTEAWQAENMAAAQDGVTALKLAEDAGVSQAELAQALEDATILLEAGATLDESFREVNAARQIIMQAGDLIHNAWLERNGSWAEEDQKLPFNQLDAHNQKLDLNLLLVALETINASSVMEMLESISTDSRTDI